MKSKPLSKRKRAMKSEPSSRKRVRCGYDGCKFNGANIHRHTRTMHPEMPVRIHGREQERGLNRDGIASSGREREPAGASGDDQQGRAAGGHASPSTADGGSREAADGSTQSPDVPRSPRTAEERLESLELKTDRVLDLLQRLLPGDAGDGLRLLRLQQRVRAMERRADGILRLLRHSEALRPEDSPGCCPGGGLCPCRRMHGADTLGELQEATDEHLTADRHRGVLFCDVCVSPEDIAPGRVRTSPTEGVFRHDFDAAFTSVRSATARLRCLKEAVAEHFLSAGHLRGQRALTAALRRRAAERGELAGGLRQALCVLRAETPPAGEAQAELTRLRGEAASGSLTLRGEADSGSLTLRDFADSPVHGRPRPALRSAESPGEDRPPMTSDDPPPPAARSADSPGDRPPVTSDDPPPPAAHSAERPEDDRPPVTSEDPQPPAACSAKSPEDDRPPVTSEDPQTPAAHLAESPGEDRPPVTSDDPPPTEEDAAPEPPPVDRPLTPASPSLSSSPEETPLSGGGGHQDGGSADHLPAATRPGRQSPGGDVVRSSPGPSACEATEPSGSYGVKSSSGPPSYGGTEPSGGYIVKSSPGPPSYGGTEPSGYIVKSSPGPAFSGEPETEDGGTGDCPMPAAVDADGFKEEVQDGDWSPLSELDFAAEPVWVKPDPSDGDESPDMESDPLAMEDLSKLGSGSIKREVDMADVEMSEVPAPKRESPDSWSGQT